MSVKGGWKERTPLSADFAARLALALCLPPMGAVEFLVSIFYTSLALRLDRKARGRFGAGGIFQLAPDDVRCQNPVVEYQWYGMDVSTHSSYLLLLAPLLLLLCWRQVKQCYEFSKFKAKPSLWVALAKR